MSYWEGISTIFPGAPFIAIDLDKAHTGKVVEIAGEEFLVVAVIDGTYWAVPMAIVETYLSPEELEDGSQGWVVNYNDHDWVIEHGHAVGPWYIDTEGQWRRLYTDSHLVVERLGPHAGL